MNKKTLGLRSLAKSIAWICCIWVAVSFLSLSVMANGPLVGGGRDGNLPCYKKYAGTAEIIRVEKTDAANANKARATEGYEVWYTFKPKGQVPNGLGKSYLEQHKQHQFVLGSSSWCPGPKFLKKYGIEKGKKFDANLMVIETGTSTPVFLELKDVPDDDYFEAAGS